MLENSIVISLCPHETSMKDNKEITKFQKQSRIMEHTISEDERRYKLMKLARLYWLLGTSVQKTDSKRL